MIASLPLQLEPISITSNQMDQYSTPLRDTSSSTELAQKISQLSWDSKVIVSKPSTLVNGITMITTTSLVKTLLPSSSHLSRRRLIRKCQKLCQNWLRLTLMMLMIWNSPFQDIQMFTSIKVVFKTKSSTWCTLPLVKSFSNIHSYWVSTFWPPRDKLVVPLLIKRQAKSGVSTPVSTRSQILKSRLV